MTFIFRVNWDYDLDTDLMERMIDWLSKQIGSTNNARITAHYGSKIWASGGLFSDRFNSKLKEDYASWVKLENHYKQYIQELLHDRFKNPMSIDGVSDLSQATCNEWTISRIELLHSDKDSFRDTDDLIFYVVTVKDDPCDALMTMFKLQEME
jgi:hypothetical protein